MDDAYFACYRESPEHPFSFLAPICSQVSSAAVHIDLSYQCGYVEREIHRYLVDTSDVVFNGGTANALVSHMTSEDCEPGKS